MEYKEFNDLQFGVFKNLAKYNNSITHFVTTRNGGVSSGSYKSLNLGMMQDDDTENVLKNRSKVASAVGLNPDDFVYPIQVHGTNIEIINKEDKGRGAFALSDAFADTDGFITNAPKICLITMAADCVPIIFFDPIKKAIGVAHAGWKGTALKIPSALVEKMRNEYGTNPTDLIVGIGPSGGPCCYEVGQDVIEEVAKNFNVKKVIKNIDDKTIFDMWEANTISLIESGVKPENIEISEVCTITQTDKFFSARRGDGGRFAAGIFIQ
ncbi:MAG: peptidoglycan editing factor PgeF [Perlabentimonas sp.]